MSGQTLFIADLHLSPSEPEVAKLFCQFLETAVTADALYILGDLFKFWIGDDDHNEFNEQIKAALKKIGAKIPVYLMPGNRDFLLGEDFAKASNCTLIADPNKINLYGRPTVLTHGDILCTKDIKLKVFRKIIRIPAGLKLFLKLPLAMRHWMASTIQAHSARAKKFKPKKNLVPQIDTINNLLEKFNSTQIIHGHTHDSETEEYNLNNQKIRRISLGEWTATGNILIYNSDGTFSFQDFQIK
jgi:UDP-2,3-diacylglucosamine hydrolase